MQRYLQRADKPKLNDKSTAKYFAGAYVLSGAEIYAVDVPSGPTYGTAVNQFTDFDCPLDIYSLTR